MNEITNSSTVRRPICLGPIPAHLKQYQWYVAHQNWLKSLSFSYHSGGVSYLGCRATLGLSHAEYDDGAEGPCEDYPNLHVFKDMDLSGANLRGLIMQGAAFQNVDFSNAIMPDIMARGSSFEGCDFEGTDLSGASFQTSQFDFCYFDKARLNEANFAMADLSNCSFENAVAMRASFRDASLLEVNFAGANLLQVTLPVISAHHKVYFTHQQANAALKPLA